MLQFSNKPYPVLAITVMEDQSVNINSCCTAKMANNVQKELLEKAKLAIEKQILAISTI